MDKNRLTSKTTWEAYDVSKVSNSIPFTDLFEKYLRYSEGKTCLEIGCSPGRFLAYICRRFGYRAEGIDYISSSKTLIESTLRNHFIYDSTIVIEDFIDWQPNKQYDLVCSFGFIEHFEGELIEEIIAKHIELIKDGGKLILEVPNFRFGQYLIHFMLNRHILNEHNLNTMKLSFYQKIAEHYGLKILHLDYWGGFFNYWTSNKKPNWVQSGLISALNRLKEQTAAIDALQQFNNRYFSPCIVFIAVK